VRVAADPDADLEGALADWRAYRRKKRVADIHWIDAFYRAYLTGIIGLVAVVAISGAHRGRGRQHAGRPRRAGAGHAGLGGIAAMAIALGLRSGSRGARWPWSAPTFATCCCRRSTVTMACGGRRSASSGSSPSWAHWSVPWPASWPPPPARRHLELGGRRRARRGHRGGLSIGAALVAAGLHLPRWFASLVALVLVGSAGLAGAGVVHVSITEPYGRLLLWPLQFHALGLLAPAVAIVLVLGGLMVVGATSLEAAERRSTLVGQLRFAATLQDLRTVVLLRRQLALELPRRRPWIRIRVKGTGRAPIVVGLPRRAALARRPRGPPRPAGRGGRRRTAGAWTAPPRWSWWPAWPCSSLGSTASSRWPRRSTTPRGATPLRSRKGHIHLRHVPVSVFVMVLTAAIAAGVAALPGSGHVPGDIAAVLVLRWPSAAARVPSERPRRLGRLQ